MQFIVPVVIGVLVLCYLATFVVERRRRRRFAARAADGNLHPEEMGAYERDGLDNPIAAEGLLRGGWNDPGAHGFGS